LLGCCAGSCEVGGWGIWEAGAKSGTCHFSAMRTGQAQLRGMGILIWTSHFTSMWNMDFFSADITENGYCIAQRMADFDRSIYSVILGTTEISTRAPQVTEKITAPHRSLPLLPLEYPEPRQLIDAYSPDSRSSKQY
jgi:hypothetical protein